jgi:hypothetical protein
MPCVATIAGAVANVVPAGTCAWIRAILEVRVRLARSPPVLELESSPAEAFASWLRARSNSATRRMQMKGSQKPKKLGKKPAQKTLKERRTEKRAAAKHASRGLDV